MGTRFELVLAGPDAATLRPAGEAALEEIGYWHQRLSRFVPDSLVSHLGQLGPRGHVRLDPDTFALFGDAARVWWDADGAFDVTVPPGRMAEVVLDAPHGTITFTRGGIALDLGAIAKGHALDQAARLLRQEGVTAAFLHGGTSSAIGIGAPPGEPGWRVALAGGGEVTLQDQALSVSATWEGNPHPTVDPRTGAPITGSRRAVVTGPSGRVADAWSTALLVLGHVPPTFPEDYTGHVTA